MCFNSARAIIFSNRTIDAQLMEFVPVIDPGPLHIPHYICCENEKTKVKRVSNEALVFDSLRLSRTLQSRMNNRHKSAKCSLYKEVRSLITAL